jgi:hypothetical protein
VTVSDTVQAGTYDTTVLWGPGRTPIQPGLDFGVATATIQSSAPTADGTGWRFVYKVAEGATPTFSVRCLDKYLSVEQGHTHLLGLERRTNQVTVPAGGVATVQVICGDNAKGIVGDFDIDAGLVALGNDPRPKTREFKFYNPTGQDLTARVGLLCLDDRTGPEVAGMTVTNVATVSSATTDPDSNDNSSSATTTIGGPPTTTMDPALAAPVSAAPTTVAPTPGTPTTTTTTTTTAARTVSGRATLTAVAPTVAVTGTTAAIRVVCVKGSNACVGTLSVKTTGGRTLASVRYTVRAGSSKLVRVAAKAFRTTRRAVVSVVGRDGRRTSRTISLKLRRR